ncbi:flagellar protein [Planococcus halocryophilus]|uniref:Flagellar protein n=1 Tax=Planococcus halocryophilus TaxID=1215089 RepID=A0A1C7DT34_9BACL|nr:flagellar protein [Planococcus halocryophilus]ANU14810.1 flagellar protein [Planococcus halocryophilus]
MGANQLSNCRICGTLFLKDYTDCCIDCYKEIEEDFKLVTDFLRNSYNRNANIQEVSQFTNIPVKQIADFIRDGRIYAEDYPNLGYPCQRCDKLIKRQMLCKECFETFKEEIDRTVKTGMFMQKTGKKLIEPQSDVQYWKLRK